MTKKLLLFMFLLVPLAFTASATANHNPVSFTDPIGDSGTSPDITRTTVANTATRAIGFLVELGNRSAMQPTDVVSVFVDADSNTTTGIPDLPGIDNIIVVGPGITLLARWNGTDFAPVQAPSLTTAWANGLLITISATDLGNTNGFPFVVLTSLTEPEDAPIDVAGPFTYQVGLPHVESTAATFAPRAPRAGRAFRVSAASVTLTTDERVAPQSYTCVATLGKARIRGRGAGGCSFTLPRTGKGKRLVVTVTMRYGGSSVAKRYTFTVK